MVNCGVTLFSRDLKKRINGLAKMLCYILFLQLTTFFLTFIVSNLIKVIFTEDIWYFHIRSKSVLHVFLIPRSCITMREDSIAFMSIQFPLSFHRSLHLFLCGPRWEPEQTHSDTRDTCSNMCLLKKLFPFGPRTLCPKMFIDSFEMIILAGAYGDGCLLCWFVSVWNFKPQV